MGSTIMREPKWYAVQSYSGHENKVQRLIERRIEEEGEDPEILEVLVPTQDVMEIRNGKRVQVTKRLYPGYVLVNLDLNERTLHAINNIQGVIKFVGGKDPQPLREDEVRKILGRPTRTRRPKRRSRSTSVRWWRSRRARSPISQARSRR